MSLVAIPASGVPPGAERLPIRAFAQSTSATIDRGISLDSASKQSARPNLAGYGPRPEAAPASRLNGFSAKPPHEIALALDVAQDNIDRPTSAHQP